MSARRTAVVDAPPASNRLSAVLRAGLERAAEGAAQTNDTGALLPSVPSGPGQLFILNPMPSMPDPSMLWQNQGLPVPGIYEDRKQFAPAQLKLLPEKLAVETDDYMNKMHFARGSGRGAVLEKMESGPYAVAQGDMYFEGGSGEEYMTAWVAKTSWFSSGPRSEGEMEDRMQRPGSEFIEFAGTKRSSQTIDKFQLKFATAKAMTDGLAPPLQGSDLEQGLLATSSGVGAAMAEFADVTHALGIGGPDYGEVIVKFGTRHGLSFTYKNLQYFPNQETDGPVLSTSKATVVLQEAGFKIVYTRAVNGDLKLLRRIAGAEEKAVLQRLPETIVYTTIAQREEAAARREEKAARRKAVDDARWEASMKRAKEQYPSLYKAFKLARDNAAVLPLYVALAYFLVAVGARMRNEQRLAADRAAEEERLAERARARAAEREADARARAAAREADVRAEAEKAKKWGEERAKERAAAEPAEAARRKAEKAAAALAAFYATSALRSGLTSGRP